MNISSDMKIDNNTEKIQNNLDDNAIEKRIENLEYNMKNIANKIDEIEEKPKVIKHYHYQNNSEEKGEECMEKSKPIGMYFGAAFGILFIVFCLFNMMIDKRNIEANSLGEKQVVMVNPVEELVEEEVKENKENENIESENVIDSLFAFANNSQEDVLDFKNINIGQYLKEKATALVSSLKEIMK